MEDEDLMVQDQLGSLVSLSYLIFSEGQPKWFPFVLLPSVPGVVWAVLFLVPFLLTMCTLIGPQLCWWSLGPLDGSWGAHMGIIFSSSRLLHVGWRATTRRASCLLIFWSFLNFLHHTWLWNTLRASSGSWAALVSGLIANFGVSFGCLEWFEIWNRLLRTIQLPRTSGSQFVVRLRQFCSLSRKADGFSSVLCQISLNLDQIYLPPS